MPSFYRRSEDPHGPLPHVSMNVQDGHVAAVITVAEQRFVVQVEKADHGWNVYWDAPEEIINNDHVYEVKA